MNNLIKSFIFFSIIFIAYKIYRMKTNIEKFARGKQRKFYKDEMGFTNNEKKNVHKTYLKWCYDNQDTCQDAYNDSLESDEFDDCDTCWDNCADYYSDNYNDADSSDDRNVELRKFGFCRLGCYKNENIDSDTCSDEWKWITKRPPTRYGPMLEGGSYTDTLED